MGKRVKSDWVGGNLQFQTDAGLAIFTIDGINRQLNLAANGILAVGGTVYPRIVAGAATVTGAATIATGLTAIQGFAVEPVINTAAKANNVALTTAVVASTVNLIVRQWKHTGPSTATLIAATNAGTVNYVVIGT